MSEADPLAVANADEPLGLLSTPTAPAAARPELSALRFEFSSRGDRVPGRMLLPVPSRPAAALLLLVQDTPGVDFERVAAGWAHRGAAVVCIELPLHGQRADPKLAARARAALCGGGDPTARMLVTEFARQALHDLARALDAAPQLAPIDPTRVGFAGIGVGALLGAAFCARDPRPRAVALAGVGANAALGALDPARNANRIEPRPILLAQLRGDPRVSAEAAGTLRATLGGPVKQRWFEPEAGALPDAAFTQLGDFLLTALDPTA